jgi:hypothetical protein
MAYDDLKEFEGEEYTGIIGSILPEAKMVPL